MPRESPEASRKSSRNKNVLRWATAEEFFGGTHGVKSFFQSMNDLL
jgi:hypothetical protein